MARRPVQYSSGYTLKTVIRDYSTGDERVWNRISAAFQDYSAGSIANYGITASETGNSPGTYTWTVPTGLPASAANYPYVATTYQIAGSDLAVSDLEAFVWEDTFDWGGDDLAAVILPPAPADAMTLTDARSWVRRAVRDGGDTSAISDSDIDRAIAYAGNYFCRETKSVRYTQSIDIEEGDDTPDLSDAVDRGFTPERRIDAIIDGKRDPLKFIDYAALNAMAADSDSDGTPAYIAFLDASTVKLYPTPDEDGTLYLRFWLPFTTINPGSTSGSTELNIPPEHLPFVLTDGAAWVLLKPSQERLEGQPLSQAFMTHCQRLTGAGNLGSRLVRRQLPEDASASVFRRSLTDPDLG